MADIPTAVAIPVTILMFLVGAFMGVLVSISVMDSRIAAGYFVDNKTLYQIVKVEPQ